MNPIDQLTADVAAENDVVDSAIVLLNGIKKRVDDGIAAARAGDFAALTKLSTDIENKTTALADAVSLNTPNAEPVPAPTPAPVSAAKKSS